MKVKQIISDVAKMLLNDELASHIDNNITLTTEEQREVNCLLKGFNLTQHEVASEYLSLQAEEQKFGDEILFSSLSHPPISILSVTDGNGDKVRFTAYANKIKLERADWYYVRYGYAPADKAMTDDFDYEKSKTGERAFLYGTASEYCLIKGRYEEASNWRAKFERAVTSPLTRGKRKIKGRIWG